MEKFTRLTTEKLDERNGGEITDKTNGKEYDNWKKYQKEKFLRQKKAEGKEKTDA